MYNITLTGKLQRFIGGAEDIYYMGETQVFFSTIDQGVSTPLDTNIALSVNDKNEVAEGEGYYVPI